MKAKDFEDSPFEYIELLEQENETLQKQLKAYESSVKDPLMWNELFDSNEALQKQVEKLEAELKGQRDGEWQEIVSLQNQVEEARETNSALQRLRIEDISAAMKREEALKKKLEDAISLLSESVPIWKEDSPRCHQWHEKYKALK